MSLLLFLLKHGKIDVSSLITHRMPLREAEEAYRIAKAKRENVQKIVLST